jgi:hypothetical protein
MRPALRFSFILFQILAIGLCLSACVYPVTPPVPGTAPTYYYPAQPTATSRLLASTGTPKITNLDMPTKTPGPLTQTALPPSTSPTPSCKTPQGWVLYTVRPGDNLFRLGVKTSVSVEDIQKANCLTSEIIFAGDALYLPFVPPVDTAVPQAPAANPQQSNPVPPQSNPNPQSDCPSPFSCSNSGLPGYSIGLGGGNDPTNYVPCQSPSDSGWIDTAPPYDAQQKPVMTLGERRYFFACDFGSKLISAKVVFADGTSQPVPLLDPTDVNPDLITGSETKSAQKVIEWAAIPLEGVTQHIGTNTLIITDANQKETPYDFVVNLPTTKHILVVPHSEAPGTTFEVYYVNFDKGNPITVTLYGEDTPSGKHCVHTFTSRQRWTVTIDKSLSASSNMGWAQAMLPSASTDPPAAYSINYPGQNVTCRDIFWMQ